MLFWLLLFSLGAPASALKLAGTPKVWGSICNGSMPTHDYGPDNRCMLFELMQALRPCASCELSRFGEANDGGYLMCSEFVQREKVSAAYSFGIHGYDGWGEDISHKLGVPVHQYDCFDRRAPTCPGEKTCDLRFHPVCVGAPTDSSTYGDMSDTLPKDVNASFQTLRTLMRRNGHGDRGNTSDLLLHMDIEGHEWPIFNDAESVDTLSEFSTIVVEFHGLRHMHGSTEGLWDPARHLNALQTLLKQFVVVHLHGNNCCEMQSFEDPRDARKFKLPRTLEVTLVRRSLLQGIGLEGNDCRSDPGFHPLDAPNFPDQPSLPAIKFPLNKPIPRRNR